MVNAVSPLVAASTVQQTSSRTSPKTLNFARTVCATKYFAANQHVAVTSSVPKTALFQMIPRMKLCAAAVLALTLVESKPRGCHYCSSELLQHTDEQMNLTLSVWCTCQHWLTCYWPSPMFFLGPWIAVRNPGDDATCCQPTCLSYEKCTQQGFVKDSAKDSKKCLPGPLTCLKQSPWFRKGKKSLKGRETCGWSNGGRVFVTKHTTHGLRWSQR